MQLRNNVCAGAGMESATRGLNIALDHVFLACRCPLTWPHRDETDVNMTSTER
jgi:hypothetical protein